MTFRIVARLDVKPPNLVKGIQLEGVRVLGDPKEFAMKYYLAGIDEISYQDVVATLYGKNSISNLISETIRDVFVPLTAGGGISNEADALELIRSGADKIAINSKTFEDPRLAYRISQILGSQAVVMGIEAKKIQGNWMAMKESGRENSNVDVSTRVKMAEDLGFGEIFLTSVDSDGTEDGPDLDLLEQVVALTDLPIIYHGGIRSHENVFDVYSHGAAGVAIASALHYKKMEISQIKSRLRERGVEVRL